MGKEAANKEKLINLELNLTLSRLAETIEWIKNVTWVLRLYNRALGLRFLFARTFVELRGYSVLSLNTIPAQLLITCCGLSYTLRVSAW